MMSMDLLFEISEPVLKWLGTLRVDGSRVRYRFSRTSGDSLFTTCFALFILDLFKETDNLSDAEKKEWADYIKSFQREEDGLFYPDPVYHPDKERAIFQATCFCLSALSILGEKPKYRLSVVDRWKTSEDVEKYLIERGCHLGYSGSGNKAMFQAILITHEYENTGDESLADAMEAWFAFHNKHQNEYGFWGRGRNGRLYAGVQNSFHQYVVYEYWEREYPRIEKVIETVLRIQDRDGYFAPVPGGGACKDYDAIHFLLVSGNITSNSPVIRSLDKAMHGIKKCWNNDGGFCENKCKPIRFPQIPKVLFFIMDGKNFSIIKNRAQSVGIDFMKGKKKKNRRWVRESQPWNESTLWDTWFRSLSLAEMHAALHGNCEVVRFHNFIGLGYNKSNSRKTSPANLSGPRDKVFPVKV